MRKVFDPKVFQLGYVALDTPDLPRAEEHYAENIGLTQTDKGDDGAVYFSIAYDHHNVVLRPGPRRAIGNIGFHLKPGIELADFAKDAGEFGLKAEIKTDSQPGVAALVEIMMPNELALQFYTDISSPAPGFKRTGVSPMRLGHVAIMSTDGDRLAKFFEEFLGFWYTDTWGGLFNFYTCNRDHHVVNIVKGTENRYHHFAFQLRDNSAHAMAADFLNMRGVKQEWGPARHPSSHNFAGYHRDPDGVMVELFTEMDAFIPELNMCEPRPWHEYFPIRPRDWEEFGMNVWGAEFVSRME